MDIHTMPHSERLAKDLSYWNDSAPAGATHYWPDSGVWYRTEPQVEVAIFSRGEWRPSCAPHRINFTSIIRKPSPAAASPVDEFPLSLVRFIKFAINCEMSDRDIAEAIRHFPRIKSKA